MTDEQHRDLLEAIGRTLLPLVSPYDLSYQQLMNQQFNNPYFRHVQGQIFHLISDNPTTLEKVLSGMAIMKSLDQRL